MNVGEAHRQHQATLEAVRATRYAFDGIVSADDQLLLAEQELDRSTAQVCRAWDDEQLRRAWKGTR